MARKWRSSLPRQPKSALPAEPQCQLLGSWKPPPSPKPAVHGVPDYHPASADVTAAARALSRPQDAQHHAIGSLAFGGLLWIAGAAPWTLPLVFLAFAFIGLPYRAWCYVTKDKGVNRSFLLDFCYFVNAATVVFLLWFPENKAMEALVYALADGPLAAALVAWQCPWVFGSAEHTISVLLHLLPGLAMFAHAYHPAAGTRGWRQIASPLQLVPAQQQAAEHAAVGSQVAQPAPLAFWLVVAPLLFYATWQLLYYVVVQVIFRSAIKRGGFDTSYNCLARRAAKANNIWNRLVRRGSTHRRCLMYGALQLAFTVTALVAFLPSFFSYKAAVFMQVLKFAFPVWYGSSYQCHKLQRDAFIRGITVMHAKATAAAAARDGAAAKELQLDSPVVVLKQPLLASKQRVL